MTREPWIFDELKRNTTWLPTPEERVAVYRRLAVRLRDRFGDDERGKRTSMYVAGHRALCCGFPRPASEVVACRQR